MLEGNETLGLCVLIPAIFWVLSEVFKLYYGKDPKTSTFPTPPGPRGLLQICYLFIVNYPLVLLQLQTLTDVGRKFLKIYGGVIYGNLMSHKVALVTNRELYTELCKHKNMQGRPATPCLVARGGNGGQFVGITANESKCWSEMRGFAVRAMKELGIGKPAVEESLVSAAMDLAKHLKERAGTPLDPCKIFNLAIDMTLLKLLTGLDLRLEDPYLQYCYDTLNGPDNIFFKEKIQATYNVFDKLSPVFPRIFGLDKIQSRFLAAHDLMQKLIDQHQLTRDKMAPRDLIDLFLNKMEEEDGNSTSGFYKERGIYNLKSMLVDLLGGNTEMATWTLAQCFLYLGYHPEVREKVEKEVREVIGAARAPRWDDRLRMPYTEAVLAEVLRVTTILWVGVERRATADTEIGGYLFPKDTILFTWLWGINHDKEYWGADADIFNPSRFLISRKKDDDQSSSQGQIESDDKNMCPYSFNTEKKHFAFGSGPRSCPGEFLGRHTLFLFFTTLIQQLDFSFDPNSPTPSLDQVEGHVYYPKPFNLIFTSKSL